MGFLCQLVSVIRVLERSFGMPGRSRQIPFFVVLRGSPMGLRGQFVAFGGSPMCFVHVVSPVNGFSYSCARDWPISLVPARPYSCQKKRVNQKETARCLKKTQ